MVTSPTVLDNIPYQEEAMSLPCRTDPSAGPSTNTASRSGSTVGHKRVTMRRRARNPGCDVAGAVEAVGPGVTAFKPGDRVWGSNQGLLGRQGSFAEYVCSGQEWFYPIPPDVSEIEAAAATLIRICPVCGLGVGTSP